MFAVEEIKDPLTGGGTEAKFLEFGSAYGRDHCVKHQAVDNEQQLNVCVPVIQLFQVRVESIEQHLLLTCCNDSQIEVEADHFLGRS